MVRRRSKTPNPPPPEIDADHTGEELVGEQIGGGRRAPSTTPSTTPTKLRRRIKPTQRATQAIHKAGRRRAQHTEPDASSTAVPVSDNEALHTVCPKAGAAPSAVSRAPSPGGSMPIPLSSALSPLSSVTTPSPGSSVPVPVPPTLPAPPPVLNQPASLARVDDSCIDPLLLAESSTLVVDEPPLPITHVVASAVDEHAISLEPSPSTQLPLPVTRVIPPTPSPLEERPEIGLEPPPCNQPPLPVTRIASPVDERVTSLEPPPSTQLPFEHIPDEGEVEGEVLELTDSKPSTPTSGRRTARVNGLLDNGYERLEIILTDLISNTSLTAQQIMDGWHKSRGRSINGTNHWNLYARYLAKNEAQERQRLGLPVETPITPGVRGRLYAKFREENQDAWQEILEIHDAIEMSDGSPNTVAQRSNSFNKISKKLTTLLEMAAAKHGFEAAVVICGNTVNQDASLGFAYTTPGAREFFETRCRADNDAMIGHLKAHVYNQVSLEVVNDAFGDPGDQVNDEHEQPGRRANLTAAAPGPSSSTDVGGADATRLSANPPANEGLSSEADMIPYIKKSIKALFESVKADVSMFKPTNFPWTALVTILANQGLVITGWPATVPMPGERSTHKSKGITILKKGEQRDLCSAFESKEITITRVKDRAEQRALVQSLSPVIIGASPPSDHKLGNAQRIYADISIDFEGPARLPRIDVRLRIKRKPARTPLTIDDDPIIISSGDDSNSPPHVPSEAVERPAKDVKRKTQPKIRRKALEQVTLDFSSDDEAIDRSGAGGVTATQEDRPDPGSRKRKGAELDSGRPGKKPATRDVKGKACAVSTQMFRTDVDLPESDGDTLSDTTVKGSSEQHDVFRAPPGYPRPVTPTSHDLRGALDAMVLSSPSPKRNARLQSLAKSPVASASGSAAADAPPAPSPSPAPPAPPVAMPPTPPTSSALPMPTAPPAPPVTMPPAPPTSSALPMLTAPLEPSAPPAPSPPPLGSAPPAPIVTSALPPVPVVPSGPPIVPPKPPALYHEYVVGEQGEWADQSRQQIGGGYPYRAQRPYFPYLGPGGMYADPVFMDPRGMYGGFHDPRYGNGSYPDLIHFNTSLPGPSRQPLNEPQQPPSESKM